MFPPHRRVGGLSHDYYYRCYEFHCFELDAEYFARNISKASWHLDQPLNHPNSLGLMFLAENACSHVKVLLSGRLTMSHITKKFPSGFRDYKLEDKVIKYWIEKNLPTTNITLDTNIAKLSPDLVSKIRLAPKLTSKIKSFELKKVLCRIFPH